MEAVTEPEYETFLRSREWTTSEKRIYENIHNV
jgi:hypothetical protein